MAKSSGDRSKPAMSSRRSKGPAATKKSMATKPKGRGIGVPGGRRTRTNDGYPAGK